MPDHYKIAKEVKDEDLDFPEPKAIRQYKQPIGPQKPQHEGVLQRIAKVAAPGLAGEAEALGKGGARAIAGKASKGVVTGFQNVGHRVGQMVEAGTDIPVWLRDQKAGKTKNTRIPGESMPAWMFGGGMPWDNPRQHSDVERITVTRIHADGSREITHRNVPVKRSALKPPRDRKPSWIKF